MSRLNSIGERLSTLDTRKCAPVFSGKEQRGTATERGYDHTWKKIRDRKLNADPLCERCEAKGRVVVAVLVHHKDRNPLNNKPENHESLCDRCHDDEHKNDRKYNHIGGASDHWKT